MRPSTASAAFLSRIGKRRPRVILDEVQRVPALFTALKAAVDRERAPGRFLLTGSSNVLLVPSLAGSLAGRMDILRLFPFAQTELVNRRIISIVRARRRLSTSATRARLPIRG